MVDPFETWWIDFAFKGSTYNMVCFMILQKLYHNPLCPCRDGVDAGVRGSSWGTWLDVSLIIDI